MTIYAADIVRRHIVTDSLHAACCSECIVTVHPSDMLLEKLEAAAATGFGGIEISENDLLNFDGSSARARQAVVDPGSMIISHQSFRDLEVMPHVLSARNLARVECRFGAMAELSIEMVLVCSSMQDIAIDDPTRAVDGLRQMAETAAERGLCVGYKALTWGRRTRAWR